MSSITENKIFESIIQSSEESKGFDILALDISKLTDIAEKFVIISGRSDRHVQGIVNRITHDLTESKIKPFIVEGYDKAHWVVLDYDSIIVHVFYQPTREQFNLEALWDQAEELDLSKILSSAAQAAA